MAELIETFEERWKKEIDDESKCREEKLREEFKEVLHNELSQRASQQPPAIKEVEPFISARVSTKGSYARTATNPLRGNLTLLI